MSTKTSPVLTAFNAAILTAGSIGILVTLIATFKKMHGVLDISWMTVAMPALIGVSTSLLLIGILFLLALDAFTGLIRKL